MRSKAIEVEDAHTILTEKQAGRARISVLRGRKRQKGTTLSKEFQSQERCFDEEQDWQGRN